MSKRIILWLEVIAIIVSIIGLAVFLPTVLSVAQTCTPEQLSAQTCTPTVSTGQGAGFVIGVLLFVVAGIVHLVAWIGALIRSAKMQTWGWFVIVLIFSGLGTLIYAIAGPSNQPAMAAYPAQGYPPQYPPQYPRQ